METCDTTPDTIRDITDAELAALIRSLCIILNFTGEEAAKRELGVTYRIKQNDDSVGHRNPKVMVSVTTEVE